MRSRLFCFALLPLFLLALALPAHADPMDNFVITGGGQTIDFSLPASTTQPCCGLPDQFNFGLVPGTVNGVNESIQVNFITGSGCAECQSILIGYPSTSWAIGLPPSLYEITFAGVFPNETETLTFFPGDYRTGTIAVPFTPFEINVASATVPTPEPATIFSLITAALALPLLMRRRTATP